VKNVTTPRTLAECSFTVGHQRAEFSRGEIELLGHKVVFWFSIVSGIAVLGAIGAGWL
jgi:hypothetical protein